MASTVPATGNQALESEIKLYTLVVDQLQRYNTIIWQLPTALLAANLLAYDRLTGQPQLLLLVSLLNASLIFGFYRIVRAQGALITAAQSAEDLLSKSYPEFIPRFKSGKASGRWVVVSSLGIADVCLMVYSIYRISH